MSDIQTDINNLIPLARKIQHSLDAYHYDPACKDANLALERAITHLKRARGYLGTWTEDDDGYPLDRGDAQ